MTFQEAYQYICTKVETLYNPREASLISKYLLEDIFEATIWSTDLLSLQQVEDLEIVIERLLNSEPWQYIGGFADFYGYKFKVNNHVLIPRPETEELALLAIQTIKNYSIKTVLDIGTGSGILPIVIAKKTQVEHTYGLDISPDALSIANQNALLHNQEITWIKGDFLDDSTWPTLPKVDLIISNPPYIDKDELHFMEDNVIRHEPHLALFVNNDSMEFYSAIGKYCVKFGNKPCNVIVEINEKYGEQVVETFMKYGLANVHVLKDLQGKDRIVIGQNK